MHKCTPDGINGPDDIALKEEESILKVWYNITQKNNKNKTKNAVIRIEPFVKIAKIKE